MNKLKIYQCPVCGNVIVEYGNAKHECCGVPMQLLKVQKADAQHTPNVSEIDGESFYEFSHPMEKGHYLSAVIQETYDRHLLVRLFPEQAAEVRLPLMPQAKVVVVCSMEGAFGM